MEKLLVTSALPYANGPLHVGHIAGAYLPADIFVRYHKLLGNDVIFICGTDEHGAPISIKADAESVSPREIVNRYHESIRDSFLGLEIDFDNFSGTARPIHHEMSQKFFLNLWKRGYLQEKTTQQWFDPVHQRFLADRYVEGICPYCGKPGARGDQCDSCGKLIDAVNLIEPRSKISGEIPVLKETSHWYLNLPKFEPELRKWLDTKTSWKDNVKNFILSWLNEGLIERSITRDIDWGVPVPLEKAAGKVLYVWFDAPIGYISSTMEWAQKMGQPDRWRDYWLSADTKLIHFLGKDNIPFHTIIWPAVLMAQDEPFVLPYDVPANEHLNLEGQKMSTSRNWTVWVNDFLAEFDGEYLRYYLAAIAPESKDSDFNWKEFQARINSELNNILGNLVNRTLIFARKYFQGMITQPLKFRDQSKKVLAEAALLVQDTGAAYAGYQVRKALKSVLDIARLGNKYFDETHPWHTVKETPDVAAETIYICAELLRIISIAAYPIIPCSMRKLRKMLKQSEIFHWNTLQNPLETLQLGEVNSLFHKIDDQAVQRQLDRLHKQNTHIPLNEHKSEITYDEFAKLEFRIVQIKTAEKIPQSSKLLKLTVDVGNETRSVIAGIARSYEPEDLIGRSVMMLINLQPRRVMGVESQAMILAAHDGEEMSVMVPDRPVKPGSEIN